MPKVKALNRNGEITWCTAKVPGHGNCNHVFHKTKDVSDGQFQQEVDNYNEKMTRLVHSGNVKWRLEAALAGYGLENITLEQMAVLVFVEQKKASAHILHILWQTQSSKHRWRQMYWHIRT